MLKQTERKTQIKNLENTMVLKTEPGIEPFFLKISGSTPVFDRFLAGFPVVDRLLTGFEAFNRTGLAPGSRLNRSDRPVRSGF